MIHRIVGPAAAAMRETSCGVRWAWVQARCEVLAEQVVGRTAHSVSHLADGQIALLQQPVGVADA